MRERFRIIQPEEARHSLVYSGELLVILLLEDVRPGDLLDFASTTYDIAPSIPDQHFGTVPLSPLCKTENYQFAIRLPESCHIKLDTPDSFSGRPSLEAIKHPDNTTSHVFHQEKTPPLILSRAHPTWYRPFPELSWTSHSSWKQVSAGVHSIWDTHIHRGLNASLIDETLETICKRGDGDEACVADLVIRWVQDEIRYLALSDGMGSFIPQSPARVIERRYGDCKDKSVLLACLLRKLGWDACPALVHSSHAHTVKERLPSLAAFDHAIVRLRKDDETYWIDPTSTGQGGTLATRTPPPFAQGLPLLEEGQDLEDIPKPVLQKNTMEVIEDVHYSQRRLTIDVETIARGSEADYFRARRATLGDEQMESGLLELMGQFYENPSSSQPLIWQDDLDANELRLVEQYLVDANARKDESGNVYLSVVASLLAGRVSQAPDTCDVTGPIALAFPNNLKHTIRVHNANAANTKGSRRTSEGPAFRFESTSTVVGKTSSVTTEYVTTKPHFDAVDWERHYEATKAMFDHLQYEVLVEKAPDRFLFYATTAAVLLVALILSGRESADSRQQARERERQAAADFNSQLESNREITRMWNDFEKPKGNIPPKHFLMELPQMSQRRDPD